MCRSYYAEFIYQQNKLSIKNQRREILKKRIRCACNIIGWLSFIYLLGTVGGLERNMLTIKEFMIHSMASLAVLLASIGIGRIPIKGKIALTICMVLINQLVFTAI